MFEEMRGVDIKNSTPLFQKISYICHGFNVGKMISYFKPLLRNIITESQHYLKRIVLVDIEGAVKLKKYRQDLQDMKQKDDETDAAYDRRIIAGEYLKTLFDIRNFYLSFDEKLFKYDTDSER